VGQEGKWPKQCKAHVSKCKNEKNQRKRKKKEERKWQTLTWPGSLELSNLSI
jgi:hypothetical protein